MSQLSGSIISWNDMAQKFTMKFFPPSRVHQIRNEVYLFRQKDHETYPKAWDRFKSAFRKCPNLDVPKLAQIYLFYNGLHAEFRNIVDASVGGSILTIEVDDAHNLFERIAENQANWLTDREAPRKIVGLHNVDAVTALVAQMEAITKKLDTLTQFVHMVQHPAPVCAGCGVDHITTSCPLTSTHMGQSAEVNYSQNYQRQNGSYPYNYHPGLNKHSNYLWVDNPDQVNQMKANPLVIQQQQGKRQSLEDLLVTYITKTETVLAAEAVNYATIELTSTTSTTPVKVYVPPISFPQRFQRQPTAEQVQAITTRSGVQLLKITVKRKETEITQMLTKDKEPIEQFEEAIEKDQQTISNNPQFKANILGTSLTPLVPFPQMLQKTKLEKQAMKFLEILKKLHVNIPFIDAILQIPNYSEFLKEMLTKKRKLPEHEIITLSEECSAITQHRIPPKLKDPGGFTLPCSIGNLQGINCLIDLGASINLIPLPLCRKLRLGDPKAASIILQLAD
ncbi:uncharacterized protein LOC111368910 [Olea europaea var. sylvestris]|uniref:uncharacterized protein LOC111368910 n=1 Tax=Olea europaea var. sylvestris TaxID=158386 RepID=UPI000C1D0F36|nr:uncharacterized protein LOC111368910 [Olea europaea var. sylvestris]